jgi:lysozyme
MNWKQESTKAVGQVVRPATKLKNVELIKEHEGLRLIAYLPTPNDVWTIGYGHTKTAKQGMKITVKQAEDLLYSDLAWVEKAIDGKVTVPLTQNQYDALACLIFNIGATAFSKSTVLKRLNGSDYKGAADAFLMWNKQKSKATGKLQVLPGLVRRREEERKLFLS